MSSNELVPRPVDAAPAALVGGLGAPDRATRVASWIGWHLFEITGMTAPAVFAVSGTPWWWLVSGVVGAGWTANEVRTRHRTAIRAGEDRPAVTTAAEANGKNETTEDAAGERGVANGDAGWTA